MSTNDRTILLVIPVIAAVVAFWFLAISPKQDKANKLDSQVTQLQASVAEQQQGVQQGLEARKQFPSDYHRLVVMGKAVPVDDETASLLVQINKIATRTDVSFRAITLGSGDSGTATAPAATTPPSDSTTTAPDASSTASTASAAPATESSAAALPIGATVGSAGLPTLPYELTFRGNYFQIADFMAGIDGLVKTRKGTVAADGRLVTIDGFSLTADDTRPFPAVKATMSVTTYLTPSDQGLTAGATPTGPATTPASATTTSTAR